MEDNFVVAAGTVLVPNDNLFNTLFHEYERVIVESLITSFGLGFLVKDQVGGDMDTILNVRQGMYKNGKNQRDYSELPAYDSSSYHPTASGTNYQKIKHEARVQARETGKGVSDAYTRGTVDFLGNSKGAPADKNAELDHVISAKAIHEDPGRVLSGLKGEELADAPENLQFTNKSLNASMGAMEIPEYIEKHPELPEETKENMMQAYDRAKTSYEAKLRTAYYTSPKFVGDLAKAAGKVGAKMAVRQVLGLVFAEIWFSVKDELQQTKPGFDLKELFRAIGNGVKRGLQRAKEKYKELIGRFADGALSGVLSSVTTTICNIFFTTAKNTVKIIRESYASLVQAGRILLFNPDGYLFGDRLRAAAKILATGASVVLGSVVRELIGKTGIGALPGVGNVAQTFCGTLVTGILTCTLLLFLDRSTWINRIVTACNYVPGIEKDIAYFREQAAYFASIAADLEKIDYDKLETEIDLYETMTELIEESAGPQKLNAALKNTLISIGVQIPWEKDFDSFMNDPDAKLVFA